MPMCRVSGWCGIAAREVQLARTRSMVPSLRAPHPQLMLPCNRFLSEQACLP